MNVKGVFKGWFFRVVGLCWDGREIGCFFGDLWCGEIVKVWVEILEKIG